MPIEIKELVIKTTVNEVQNSSSSDTEESQGNRNSGASDNDCASKLEEVRDEIIAECIEFMSGYLTKLNRR